MVSRRLVRYKFLLVAMQCIAGDLFVSEIAFLVIQLTTSSRAIQQTTAQQQQQPPSYGDSGQQTTNLVVHHYDHQYRRRHVELGTVKTDMKETASVPRNRSGCPVPCRCARPEEKLQCKGGVNIVRDGCDCCFICARQQGDLCDFRHRCDEEKEQFCDFTLDDGLRGICRAQLGKSCQVHGRLYKDGEHFQLNCSQLCTCQNGQYACASLCPQEERAPSRGFCKDLQLISIGGRCCKEWVCPHSNSLPHPNDNDDDDDDEQRLRMEPKRETCSKETTGWSQCSVTCGFGWSVRLTNDNDDCLSTQERRLCIIRPCHLNDKHLQGRQCKTTWKESSPLRITSNGCVSVKEYRPKYCSTCKKTRCCRPELTKTLLVDMLCTTNYTDNTDNNNNNNNNGNRNNNNNNNNRTVTEKLMWVKSCRCMEVYCVK